MKDKTLRIFKVRAVPLNNFQTKVGELSFDYVMSFTKGLPLTFKGDAAKIEVGLIIVQQFSQAIFSKGDLSYKYKAGDVTFFEVQYQQSPKKFKEKFAFVTEGKVLEDAVSSHSKNAKDKAREASLPDS